MDQFTTPGEIPFSGVPGRIDHIEGRRWTGADAPYLRALVESSFDVVTGATLEGHITVWNQGAELLYGYTTQETLGQSVGMIVPLERKTEFLNLIADVRARGTHRHYQTVRVKKDGSLIDVVITLSPVIDDAGVVVGASMTEHDLTDFQRQEAALQEAQKRKDIFLSMASHELKTPLASIKAYTQILEKMFAAEGNATATQYLARMDTQIDKLTKLATDLLYISRVQAAQLEFARAPFDVDALVRDVVQDIQTTAPNHLILLSGEAHTELTGDRDRIGQVLSNLLTNAIKFSPEANTVRVNVEADSTQVTFSVQDYGVGIPAQHQGHIFELFYRVYGAQNKAFPGLGVGLYISAEIVKQHGGRIWFESAEREGSTFSFSLPVSE